MFARANSVGSASASASWSTRPAGTNTSQRLLSTCSERHARHAATQAHDVTSRARRSMRGRATAADRRRARRRRSPTRARSDRGGMPPAGAAGTAVRRRRRRRRRTRRRSSEAGAHTVATTAPPRPDRGVGVRAVGEGRPQRHGARGGHHDAHQRERHRAGHRRRDERERPQRPQRDRDAPPEQLVAWVERVGEQGTEHERQQGPGRPQRPRSPIELRHRRRH